MSVQKKTYPSVSIFERNKKEQKKISMVTCYDYWSARLIEETSIDCVLVGDSVSMVVHGFPSTVHASTEMMCFHVAAVSRGLRSKFLVADMPFLSVRKGVLAAMECVDLLMKSGAHAVKIEGVWGHEEVIQNIVQSGVPVMGHIGLTPQSIHGLGGFRVQGRDEKTALDLIAQAKKLQELGCFSIVLECVPNNVARDITDSVLIPTIGIGAGNLVDGQVLVLQDLLGINSEFKPKFVRTYLEGEALVARALEEFHTSVVDQTFPKTEESYG